MNRCSYVRSKMKIVHKDHHDECCKEAPALEQISASIPGDDLLASLAVFLKTFGDPTRVKIMYSLMNSSLCVADIAKVTQVSQSAVSHQLRLLKQAMLVKSQRSGKNVIYSISDTHVSTILEQAMTHICE